MCAQKTQLFGESLPKNAQKRLFGLFFQKFARVVEKKANSNVNSVNFLKLFGEFFVRIKSSVKI